MTSKDWRSAVHGVYVLVCSSHYRLPHTEVINGHIPERIERQTQWTLAICDHFTNSSSRPAIVITTAANSCSLIPLCHKYLPKDLLFLVYRQARGLDKWFRLEATGSQDKSSLHIWLDANSWGYLPKCSEFYLTKRQKWIRHPNMWCSACLEMHVQVWMKRISWRPYGIEGSFNHLKGQNFIWNPSTIPPFLVLGLRPTRYLVRFRQPIASISTDQMCQNGQSIQTCRLEGSLKSSLLLTTI